MLYALLEVCHDMQDWRHYALYSEPLLPLEQGEDEQVQAAYKQAQAGKADTHPVLLHLAAVAAFRLGDEKSTWIPPSKWPAIHCAATGKREARQKQPGAIKKEVEARRAPSSTSGGGAGFSIAQS